MAFEFIQADTTGGLSMWHGLLKIALIKQATQSVDLAPC
jgi:hypothetical protein